jgi:PAS domain S-box-containing protein
MVEQKHPSVRQVAREGATRRKKSDISLNILDILNAIPFYVLLVDESHYILEANSAVYKQLGVKREDILGKYCPMAIHGLPHAFPGCPLEDAVEKNKAIDRELFDPQSGRWCISSIYPITATTGYRKRVYLHMVTDVTERKLAEEQLKTSRERLRSLSAHLESVREEEKRKIARDLHDETSQVLASLTAHLEAAIETLPARAKRTETILRKAQALSVMILDELHKLIYDLRPANLDELGLMAAISSMVDSHLKPVGLKVSMKVSGKVRRLSPSLEIELFRVIQEAFNNIVKHAHADNVYVNIHFKKSSIKICIQDDGVGFDFQKMISSIVGPRGLGLLGMKERVELMNGSLVVNSSSGRGTEINMEFPLIDEVHNG